MKRIVFIMIFAICCLAGCKAGQERVAEADSAVIYTRGQGFSKEGITFVQNEIVQYTNFSTGETMPLCSRLNCSHRALTMTEEENGAEPCMAYVKNAYQAVLYREKLYVFTEEKGGICIYVSEADGANRELLTEISNVRWSGAFSTEFYGDWLVMVANRLEQLEGENGEITMETYAKLYCIDCETGEMTVSKKEWNDSIGVLEVDETSVYVCYDHIDDALYEKYTKAELKNDPSLYDEYQIVELWKCNLEDGNVTEICAGKFGGNCYPIAVNKDGVIYGISEDDGKASKFYMSFSTDEEVVMPFDSLRVFFMTEDYALLSTMEGPTGEAIEVIYQYFYKDGTLERVETDPSLTPNRIMCGNLYCSKGDYKTRVVPLDVFLSGGSEELYVMERLIYDTIR